MNNNIKLIKIVFRTISVLVLLVGLFFSYMIAEFDDAPGIVIIGSTITFVISSFVYGFSELIIGINKNNILLTDIHKELINKKK